MQNFSIYNVQLKKHPIEQWVVVSGEICNDTSKSYNTAVFHLKLFSSHDCLGATLVKLRGVRAKATKDFEVLVEGVHHEMLSRNVRCEIFFESAY